MGRTPYNDVRFACSAVPSLTPNASSAPTSGIAVGIPIIALIFMVVHFWRVRKDGGISGPNSVISRIRNQGTEEIAWIGANFGKSCPRPITCDYRADPAARLLHFLAWRQAHANDLLIAQLEGDAALAKTHHRKAWPFKARLGKKEVHVWPFLLRVEFLAAIIVTIILMVWSITLNAPLEEPANPKLDDEPPRKRHGISSASRKCWSTSTRGLPAWSCPLSSSSA